MALSIDLSVGRIGVDHGSQVVQGPPGLPLFSLATVCGWVDRLASGKVNPLPPLSAFSTRLNKVLWMLESPPEETWSREGREQEERPVHAVDKGLLSSPLCVSLSLTHTRTHCLSLSLPLAHNFSPASLPSSPSPQRVKHGVIKQLLKTRVKAEWLERGTRYLPCFGEVRWA